jgi:hypothetical protein
MRFMSIRKSSLSATLPLIVTLILSLAALSVAGTPEALCNWMAEPGEVDGILDEWKNMPTTFFKDERLVLGAGNDSDFLYLFFRTDNPNTLRTIQMSGISIWLDRKGKKKKDLCYHFRGGPSMDEIREAGLIDTIGFEDRRGDREIQMMIERMGQARDKITITDKDLDLEQVIPIDGSYGPTLSFAFEGGFCIYELRIPLQDHLVDYFGFNAAPGQKIGIGAKWGGSPRHMGDNPSGGMGGSGGGFKGGMGGGRGGGLRGDSDRNMKMPESKEIWVKTVLAIPPADEQEDN